MRNTDLRNLPAVIISVVIFILLIWLVVILPIQHYYKSRFMELNDADVSKITIETVYRVDASFPKAKIVLSENERRDFIKLLAECRLTALNHPRGLWVCTAMIMTKDRMFELSIHHTSNNGTYIPLYSNGDKGRNIGDFRNDKLSAFILHLLNCAD